MAQTVIQVENLSKQYRIGGRQESYGSLRESLTHTFSNSLSRIKNRQSLAKQETIWALKDVSFDVKQGEVIGIIGRNGAGKSTLLKILSRITKPTTGQVTLRGRVGSLLEVGTGFHPELTGRDNIYLNGAILGMHRSEIEQKFDEIVDFSEIEQFLDTPVKRYSSGMYVRLAFAVAAHLEPEILLVDEVLAVGDAAFQKKCLGKMGGVAQGGRTVLFVSHNMAAIQSLCTRAILLDSGQMISKGDISSVIHEYMERIFMTRHTPLWKRPDRGGDGSVRLDSIKVTNSDGNPILKCTDKLCIQLSYSGSEELSKAVFLIRISDQIKQSIFMLNSEMAGGLPDKLPAVGSVSCVTGPINLTPTTCMVNVALIVGGTITDNVKQAIVFEVEPDDFYGTGKLPNRQDAVCILEQGWRLS